MEYRYSLHGEVDLATAPQLRSDLERALDAEGAHLLVDCTGLRFIDSAGIAVLLATNAKLEAAGRHMLILNVEGGPRLAFEALGLTDLFRYDRDTIAS
jgi:anti-anti-sigma factor